MRITHIDKWQVVVPIDADALNSPEFDPLDEDLAYFWKTPKHIIRIHTDDSGIVGIGETPRGCPAAQMERAIETITGMEVDEIDLHALPVPGDRGAPARGPGARSGRGRFLDGATHP